MSILTANNIVYKQPTEVIRCTMPFYKWMADDEEITGTPTVEFDDEDGPTVDDISIADGGKTVEFFLSEGEHAPTTRLRLNVTVTTDGGQTLVGDGIVIVSST